MKKARFIIILICFVFTSDINNIIYAAPTKDIQLTGKILESLNIVFIDGRAIKSYNIKGYSYICAEDLMNYGFDIRKDSKINELNIIRDQTKLGISTLSATDINILKEDIKPGRETGIVYKNTETVFMGNKVIDSYKLEEKTMIPAYSLSEHGYYEWIGEGITNISVLDKEYDDMMEDTAKNSIEEINFTSYEEAGYTKQDLSVDFPTILNIDTTLEELKYLGGVNKEQREGYGEEHLCLRTKPSYDFLESGTGDVYEEKYEGYWKSNIRKGYGVKSISQYTYGLPGHFGTSDKFVLVGNFDGMHLNGYGEKRNINEERPGDYSPIGTNFYQGYFKNGILEGKARYCEKIETVHMGDSNTNDFLYGYVVVYDGDFKNGLRDGMGTEYSTMSGKKIYEGEWKEGFRNGRGKEYSAENGLLIFEGVWEKGIKIIMKGELICLRSLKYIF